MPKPDLPEPLEKLEREIIEALLHGHREWRPDLPFPESYSDMQGAVRGLLCSFDVTRRSGPRALYPRLHVTEANAHLLPPDLMIPAPPALDVDAAVANGDSK